MSSAVVGDGMRLGALSLSPSDDPVSGVMVVGHIVDGGGMTVGLVIVIAV